MTYTKEDINWVYVRMGGRCFYCGILLSFEQFGLAGEPRAWDINDFIPAAKNGESCRDNWVPACISCSTIKGELFPWEFDARRFKHKDEQPHHYIL